MRLQESLWIRRLTPEQRAILFLWYGSDSEYGWTREDFVHGIRKAICYYPDHRPEPVPPFRRSIADPDDEPL